MSRSARKGASGTRPRSVMTWLGPPSGSWSNWTIRTEWIGDADGGDTAGGQHRDLVDAQGAQRSHGTARGGAEPDHDRASDGGRSRRWSRSAAVRAGPSSSRRARCSCGRRAGRPCRRGSSGSSPRRRSGSAHRSIAIWVSSVSWTQCGHPHSACPWRSAATSSSWGLSRSTTSESLEQLLARGEAGDVRARARRRCGRTSRRTRARA